MCIRRFSVAFILTFAALAVRAADPTVAFYTFNDAEPGTDATTVSAISNSLDETAHVGSVTKTANGTVEFRAEAPGAYILNGVDGVTLAKDPQSLWFDGTAVAEGGQLSLAEIIDSLAATNAFTIEFFFMKPTSLAGADNLNSVIASFDKGGGTTVSFYAPYNAQTNVSMVISGVNRVAHQPDPLQDGKWHHIAITGEKVLKPDGSLASQNFWLTLDYTKLAINANGYTGWPTWFGSTAAGPFTLGGGSKFRGYISCVRVSHKLLTADQMLKASSTPMYDPGDDDVQVDAVTPKARWTSMDNWWALRLEEKRQEIAERGDEIETVFLGDSLTQLWQTYGRDTWPVFDLYHPINLGFTADSTGHVLFRINEGELDGYKAKAVVLLIGTNNLGSEPLRHTWRGVKAIVDAVREKQPQAKIILHALFPRGDGNFAEMDRKIRILNGELQKLADGKKVVWLDIHDKFLNADGSNIDETLYYTDKLHIFQKGYPIWAEALLPVLADCFAEPTEYGSFRPGTIAFYPFDDAPVGVCITNRTVKNAVDPAKFAGTSDLYETAGFEGTARVELSPMRPGKYVFDGSAYGSTPIITNPRSLFIAGKTKPPSGGGTVQSGGRLQLEDLATAMMSNSDYTVEFFYMIPKTATSFNWFAESFSWSLDGTACGLRVPEHNSGDTTMMIVSFYRGAYHKGYTYPQKLTDDLWHHVAAVRKNGKTSVYCDYVNVSDTVNDAAGVGAESKPLIIANGRRFQGYVSCFRVLTNALSVAEMMHASDDPNCYPRTVCHWSFGGTPGEKLSSISNNCNDYARCLAGQYFYEHDATNLTGFGKSSTVVCSADFARRRPLVMEGTNLLAVSSTGGDLPYAGGFASAYLPRTAHIPVRSGSFTIETFFKFAGWDTWISRPGRPSTYCALASKPAKAGAGGDGRGWDFWFGLWVYGSGSLIAQVQTKPGASNVEAVQAANTKFYDGGWHHYAFVYDETVPSIKLYFDYALAAEKTLTAPISRSIDDANNMLYLGTGGGAGSFEGKMDEMRYSRAALGPDDFLRCTRVPSGLMLLFR